ncbi:MAG: hypothetical protein IKT12_02610 [Thermoguttaceae bacterium]|nr:hypothetical protein [Thermoguttaceae bacterium]
MMTLQQNSVPAQPERGVPFSAPVPEQERGTAARSRLLPGWRPFLTSGVIWLLIALSARGVWSAGTFTARQVRRFRQLIEWTETLPFGGDDSPRPFFDRRRKSRDGLEAWIAASVPRNDRRGVPAAARAFRETAGMLRAGDLLGRRDAMAELTARLTPEVDRETWLPFLTELSDRLADEIGPDGEDAAAVADVLDRAAGALEGAASKLLDPFSPGKLSQPVAPASLGGLGDPEPGLAVTGSRLRGRIGVCGCVPAAKNVI